MKSQYLLLAFSALTLVAGCQTTNAGASRNLSSAEEARMGCGFDIRLSTSARIDATKSGRCPIASASDNLLNTSFYVAGAVHDGREIIADEFEKLKCSVPGQTFTVDTWSVSEFDEKTQYVAQCSLSNFGVCVLKTEIISKVVGASSDDDPFGDDPFSDDPFADDPFSEEPTAKDPYAQTVEFNADADFSKTISTPPVSRGGKQFTCAVMPSQ